MINEDDLRELKYENKAFGGIQEIIDEPDRSLWVRTNSEPDAAMDFVTDDNCVIPLGPIKLRDPNGGNAFSNIINRGGQNQ